MAAEVESAPAPAAPAAPAAPKIRRKLCGDFVTTVDIALAFLETDDETKWILSNAMSGHSVSNGEQAIGVFSPVKCDLPTTPEEAKNWTVHFMSKDGPPMYVTRDLAQIFESLSSIVSRSVVIEKSGYTTVGVIEFFLVSPLTVAKFSLNGISGGDLV